MKLDSMDIKILSEIQKNGRITNIDLSEKINLSASPCLARVKKLQDAGYILGYHAQINIAKLGRSLTVFTEITLKNHRRADFARFLQVVEREKSIMECHNISGGYDYLLKFLVNGIDSYQSIMERLVSVDIGIDKYFSYVVLKTNIHRYEAPLSEIYTE